MAKTNKCKDCEHFFKAGRKRVCVKNSKIGAFAYIKYGQNACEAFVPKKK